MSTNTTQASLARAKATNNQTRTETTNKTETSWSVYFAAITLAVVLASIVIIGLRIKKPLGQTIQIKIITLAVSLPLFWIILCCHQ